MSGIAKASQREVWATRIGLILAMAGNAIGLGNFLRFPRQAALNGGGAFMIPYFLALLLLGVPLMWVEWSIGRLGGRHGYGTTPGMFSLLWRSRWAKYLGALGVGLPLALVIYYGYIESWTLAYGVFSVTGKYWGILTREGMGSFLHSYQGLESGAFPGVWVAYGFFVVTALVNYWIISRGVVRGIETLAKIAMPVLFLFAVALVIRVFTLGTPDPGRPENNILNGLAFMWNPDFSKLGSSAVWLAAAGQIFFTLSIGTGCIQTYASYLREKDDVALTGLTTSTTNEFAEVILGGSIAIPVAVAFFGLAETREIATEGSFNLGFQAMPVIFQKIALGKVFGGFWFLLLFFAGITSSVALMQPAVAFLQDELKMTRRKAAFIVFLIVFCCGQPVVFFLGHGFLDEMDFWVGNFGLVVFAVIEIILFAWVFRMQNAWKEITMGADIKLPRVFYYIIHWVTPAALLTILGFWFYQQALPTLFMKDVPAENVPYLWGARIMLLGIFAVFILLVRRAWKRKPREGGS
jgi:NSS family neurotransmitter:Na+ symporter